MRVSITPKAMAKIRADIAALGGSCGSVLIFRGPVNTDLRRGQNGEIIWTKRGHKHTWRTMCIPFEWPAEAEMENALVEGVKIFLVAALWPDARRDFRISVVRGKLNAMLAA